MSARPARMRSCCRYRLPRVESVLDRKPGVLSSDVLHEFSGDGILPPRVSALRVEPMKDRAQFFAGEEVRGHCRCRLRLLSGFGHDGDAS